MDFTPNLNLPIPNADAVPPKNISDQFPDIALALTMLDEIIHTLQGVVAGKAAADHTQAISTIIGLTEALAAKMPANTTFSLDSLTDVQGAADALVNYVLVKKASGQWEPSTALAALGIHNHSISEVVGLADQLVDILDALDVLTSGKADAISVAEALALRLRVDAAQPFTVSQQDRGRANIGVPGRNLIINGQGRINQRVYISGAATTAANQFTLDRWFVVTSGQNLSFTGDDSRRVMTAPAGGVSQVIEGNAIVGGTYVLNWTGTATATVNGTARAKGEAFTLPANTNATVRFSTGTFTDVQLELASVPSTFERRLIAQELALCQRYYIADANPRFMFTRGVQTPNSANGNQVEFPVTMRATPTFVVGAASFMTGVSVITATANGAMVNGAANSASSPSYAGYTADAELTS